jgi:thiol-disulfide isomerase/thioredoxin
MGDAPGKVIFIVAIAFLVYGVLTLFSRSTTPTTAQNVALVDVTSGQTYDLAEFKGKVVLLNFFGTTCPPCEREMPVLKRLHEDYKDADLVLLAVNAWREQRQALANFVKANDVQYPVLADPGAEAARLYGVKGVPHTVLIARDGRVAATHTGYEPGIEEQLRKDIDALLAEPAPGDGTGEPANATASAN